MSLKILASALWLSSHWLTLIRYLLQDLQLKLWVVPFAESSETPIESSTYPSMSHVQAEELAAVLTGQIERVAADLQDCGFSLQVGCM